MRYINLLFTYYTIQYDTAASYIKHHFKQNFYNNNSNNNNSVIMVTINHVCCDVQLVPDLRRPPVGRGCSVESDSFAARDIRYLHGAVSVRWPQV